MTQLRHCVYDRMTLAVEFPEREQILLIRDGLDAGRTPVIKMSIGLARMHPKDKNYVKKIGRETALANVKDVEVQVGHITSQPGEIRCLFVVTVNEKRLQICCKLTKDYKTPHLTHVLLD